ncbi:G patch domain and ankyrin repeat-containing protein 1 [Gastrophryne carolinensis]
MNFPRLITFTKAREKSDFWENGEHSKEKPPKLRQVPTTGQEARSFYESLLVADEEKPASGNPSRKRKARRSPPCVTPNTSSSQLDRASFHDPTNQRLGHQLLKCSQDGDMKGVRKLVEKERCDVNFRDGYYWTAMMCAAYAGNKDIVNYLLKQGAAWVGVCETQGKDALMLAEDAGHQDVVELLQNSLRRRRPQEVESRAVPQERKHCDVCRTHYQEDSVDLHERSTVHLFNKKKKLPPTYYAIPDHNVGFKMMVKEGWNRESGLGPEGTGRKFPVQTVLKRDYKGLGFQTEKPKVTHFAANDTEAVARPQTKSVRNERVATISRKEERRKEAKAKAWERDLRTYMNIDL